MTTPAPFWKAKKPDYLKKSLGLAHSGDKAGSQHIILPQDFLQETGVTIWTLSGLQVILRYVLTIFDFLNLHIFTLSS